MEHKKLFFIILIFGFLSSNAQIKIGDNPEAIDASSLLELESTSRTLVLTRVSTIQMQAINPLMGAVVYNIDDQCVYYYDGSQWNNLCSGSGGAAITDNGDGTYTVDDNINPPFTFDGAPENISTLIDNTDGTYTYTNEVGVQTTFTPGAGGASIIDNGDGTYTVDDGTSPPFTFDGAPENITTLVDNTDGTYTYTNEIGVDVTITTGGMGGHTGSAGSVFFADSSTGAPTENNAQFFWNETDQQLGIGSNITNSTLHVGGTISTPIDFQGGPFLVPGENQHTILIQTDCTVILPPTAATKGRIYIIKVRPGLTVTTIPDYVDSNSALTTIVATGVIWLQSNGFGWEQIN